MEATIWHNPRCGKSRETLALVREHGADPTVREYLKDPPDAAELERVLGLLGLEPRQLMRTKEAVYKELGLATVTDRAALVQAMVDNPILIERPIVIAGGRAALGRPPEAALAVLEASE